MGTNYYARKTEPNYIVCPRCGEKIPNGETVTEIHIGKASYGWSFLFHTTEFFRTFPEFMEFVNKYVKNGKFTIFDEYGRRVDVNGFLTMVKEMQNTRNPDNFLYDDNRDGYRFTDSDFS